MTSGDKPQQLNHPNLYFQKRPPLPLGEGWGEGAGLNEKPKT